ncbi:MAG: amidohydrolase [Zestosphaera sp.]
MLIGFVNGNIYVSFKPFRKAEAMAVAGGRVVYAGKREVVEVAVKALGGDLVDLGGRTVLPGFIDAHLHLDELGMYLNMLDLRGVGSVAELKERVREYARGVGTTWVLGHGWDQELFKEGRWPTRHDLDEVVSDRPVMLSRVCMHAAVLNTKAMEITGLMRLESPGLMRDERGIPTGVVKEEAFDVARRKFEESLTDEDYVRLLEDAARFATSHGVTTVGFVSCDVRSLKALTRLKDKGRLTTRVRVYLNPGEEWEVLRILKKLGVTRGFGDDFLKIMGVKILADGSLGARTAWLSEPYSDDPTTSGYPNIDEESLKKLVKEVHKAGLQLAVHGIGDKTIDLILDAYEELDGVKDRRHRIEHASVLREDQVERMARLGVVASVQPHFVITDWWVKNRVGEGRVRWVYPFKTMTERGIKLGFSTDSPVEVLNPWETVYAAVTRGRHEKIPLYEDTERERLTVREALHAYTWGSAYIMFEEDSLGSLEEGKLADFIVVDKDPLTVDEIELRNLKVLETYVGGRKQDFKSH